MPSTRRSTRSIAARAPVAAAKTATKNRAGNKSLFTRTSVSAMDYKLLRHPEADSAIELERHADLLPDREIERQPEHDPGARAEVVREPGEQRVPAALRDPDPALPVARRSLKGERRTDEPLPPDA